MPRPSTGYVELGAVAGHALNCEITRFTKFDRKHYCYPDLVKGYQISQDNLPLCHDGFVELFKEDGTSMKVRIERIHLEEDVGKSLHLEGSYSYIDYNRSGTPLIEIVSRPDMSSPEEAALFLQTLQEILRYVNVTDGNLEEGSMRCDANINLKVWENGKEFRTPISEVKNLNSFRAIREACTYEIQRQLQEFENTNTRQAFTLGFKRTFGWDEAKKETIIQRTKEAIIDYRFLAEPDIKPFSVSEEMIEHTRSLVGELPQPKRERLKREYGLSDFDVQTLTGTRQLALWFEEAAAKAKEPKRVANWILGEVLGVLNVRGITIDQFGLTPAHIAGLANAVSNGTITGKQAKDVFALMLETGKTAETVIAEEHMAQVADSGAIEAIVKEILEANPKAIEDYKSGKSNALGWLMGQVMKKSKGQANPAIATELLKKELEKC
jgi:aspartyl-tRNA(Asn)/glutamyl-tRNA(Gln) amidotransferase subunit B